MGAFLGTDLTNGTGSTRGTGSSTWTSAGVICFWDELRPVVLVVVHEAKTPLDLEISQVLAKGQEAFQGVFQTSEKSVGESWGHSLAVHFQVAVHASLRFRPENHTLAKAVTEKSLDQSFGFLSLFLGLPGIVQVDVEIKQRRSAGRNVVEFALLGDCLLETPQVHGTQDHFVTLFAQKGAGSRFAFVQNGMGDFAFSWGIAGFIERPLVARNIF
jgi:hypothetical protein